MSPEVTRRAGALAALGAFGLLLFTFSLLDKETVPMQCVRLGSAQLVESAELVDASRAFFPFGITCTYAVEGEQQVLEQTSWMPVVPLAGGASLLALSTVVAVTGDRSRANVRQ